VKSRSFFLISNFRLFRQLVALFEFLNSTGGIHHLSLTGEERMAFVAQLDAQTLFGGTDGESIAAGTNHLGIFKKFGMNFFFHSLILQRKR